jgi:aryl-alcohol dehydrogenase-like predicted oxidoreductase
MKYRTLGNTGLVVSALSLGTMQFGKKMNMGALGLEQASSMIDLALAQGINLIDTADVYSLGESEILIGQAVRERRHEVVLATKARLPMSETNVNHSGATRVNLLREAEASLRRLQTDYIDLYQIHGWDSVTPLEETLRTLDDLVRSGKVRYIGLSNYHAWQAATALALQEREHLEKYVTAQLYYSLVGRDLEADWLGFAQYARLGILVWSPLAGGYLSGKYAPSRPAPEHTRYAEAGNFVPFDRERGQATLSAVRAVAERHGKSCAQISLAWLLTRPAISSVVIAARTNERLAENIDAVNVELDARDLEELDRASDPGRPYPRWMVEQLDLAEDPRPRLLAPAALAADPSLRDRRGTPWDPS